MKRISPIMILVLLFLIEPMFALHAEDPPLNLVLKIGEVLVYEIVTEKKENSSNNINNTSSQRIVENKTRLELIVKEIPEPGVYIFSYKKEFMRIASIEGENYDCSDSRFPDFGQDLKAIISYYLNTVDFNIKFDTKSGTLRILDIKKIESDLLNYVESRGFRLDQHTKITCENQTDEKLILQDLEFLNFYPGTSQKKEWFNTQSSGNIEYFTILNTSKDKILLASEMPEYKTYSYGVTQKGIRLPRILTIDIESGILLSASSTTKNFIQYAKSNEFEKVEHTNNFNYHLKLVRYSKWDKPTFLTGKLINSDINKLCLELPNGNIGSEVIHKIVDVEPNGNFSIPLGINSEVRGQLYILNKFPIGRNQSVDLFIEPGDSIHIVIDGSEQIETLFSGKGYENSNFLENKITKLYPPPFSSLFNPWIIPNSNYLESLDNLKTDIEKNEIALEGEKEKLSSDFYRYMKSENFIFQKMLVLINTWVEYADNYNSGKPVSASIPKTLFPSTPSYEYYQNLRFYSAYVGIYSGFRFQHFVWFTLKKFPARNYEDQFAFSRILLGGYPLYTDLISQLEIVATAPFGYRYGYMHFYEDFLKGSNSVEANEYVRNLYRTVEALQPGKEIPRMELLDLAGYRWDWEKTKGKIVVLMLFNDYESSQIFSEELYKEYGKNSGDVIILRISPGFSFENWRKENTKYSGEMHQMYFSEGVDAFSNRFGQTFDYSKQIVVDRSGKIFRYSNLHDIKSAIKDAQEQTPPPKKPLMETTFARIFFGAFLGMILTFIFYRSILARRMRRWRLTLRMADLEQKAMKAQLNPHFLFNSLNSIQHLIRSGNLNDSSSYLTVFASLMRKILDNSAKDRVSIAEELESLKLYIELEQMRFDFIFEIEIDPVIDIFNTMIPPMLIQPVLENAVIHGLSPKIGEKRLSIMIKQEDDLLAFYLEDNGVGRTASSKSTEEHESRGLAIIEDRIKILNKAEPGKYFLAITDKVDEKQNSLGTMIKITIPDEK